MQLGTFIHRWPITGNSLLVGGERCCPKTWINSANQPAQTIVMEAKWAVSELVFGCKQAILAVQTHQILFFLCIVWSTMKEKKENKDKVSFLFGSHAKVWQPFDNNRSTFHLSSSTHPSIRQYHSSSVKCSGALDILTTPQPPIILSLVYCSFQMLLQRRLQPLQLLSVG